MSAQTRVSDLFVGPGVHAARPLYTDVPRGTLYVCTEHSLIYRADAGGWTTWLAYIGTGGLSGYAPLASPALTGNPTAPTPTVGDNDTSIATTAFVSAAIAALVNASPTTLDTLKELADALGDDPNFATTMTTALGLKAPLASPAFTGNPTAPTASPGDNDTSVATTAFVAAAVAAVSGAGIAVSLIDAKGDLLVGTANDTIARQAAGANDTVLMYDSAQTAGVKAQALDDSYIAPVAPNDQTGTTYTFVLADKHRTVTGSNASAQTHTVPPNSSVSYALGAVLTIVQKGAGQITLAPGAGVTLQSAHGLKTSAQWAVVSLTKILTDTWVVSGDTTT